MKKFIIMFVIVVCTLVSGFSFSNTQSVNGTVYRFYDSAYGDYITTVIIDENGKCWSVDDFVAPRDTDCTIIFDNNNNIIQINTFWKP